MQALQAEVKKHIEPYYSKCERIKSQYANFHTKEVRSVYSGEFIQTQLNNEITALNEAINEVNNLIEESFISFTKRAERMDMDTINSIEYQTKLSNVMNLLNLDSNLDMSYFDFMVEARDYKTLELLANKYKSSTLKQAYNKVDVDEIISQGRVMLFMLKNYLSNDKNFKMKNEILKTIIR